MICFAFARTLSLGASDGLKSTSTTFATASAGMNMYGPTAKTKRKTAIAPRLP